MMEKARGLSVPGMFTPVAPFFFAVVGNGGKPRWTSE